MLRISIVSKARGSGNEISQSATEAPPYLVSLRSCEDSSATCEAFINEEVRPDELSLYGSEIEWVWLTAEVPKDMKMQPSRIRRNLFSGVVDSLIFLRSSGAVQVPDCGNKWQTPAELIDRIFTQRSRRLDPVAQ